MSTSQKQAARKFVERWTFRRGSEKGEDQQFWNSLLGEVLGMEDVASRVQYQVPVPMGGRASSRTATTKFLDAWIPETRVLIEHKSRGVSLDAPQAGHGGLTPYEQAVEYDNARPFDEKARWIVTCNFDEFRIYDRSRPLAPPLVLRLGNLPKEAYRLAFLVNPKEKAIDRELEISVQAGRIVGEIYDALLGQYDNGRVERAEHVESTSPLKTSTRSTCSTRLNESCLAALNRLCVRLVFCLYAEDADIFPKDCFRRLMEATPVPFLRERLIRLFQVLDTPSDRRNPYLEPELCVFPYTNGGLFRNAAESDIPPMTEEIRQLLIGASLFDWREITPTIFGALFESTLNPVTRRAGGMVYTSVENIHKVIDPLFLDDLTRRVNEILGERPEDVGQRTVGQSSALRKKLLALQDEIASLTFLDPACGSGNFLTETYICLRRLENRIIAAIQKGQGELDLDCHTPPPLRGTSPVSGEGFKAANSPSKIEGEAAGRGSMNRVKVSIAQFFGLEINDFAVAVAKTALWIAESQMKQETAEILHREPDYLPLKDNANIVEGNALRTEWPCTSYIMGNPPFRGASNMSDEQKADTVAVFGKGRLVNSLDLVGAWFHKAAQCGPGPRCAFVATNSIAQGEQVAPLWKPLVEKYGVEIDFAWRTFRWDNEAAEKAHVHCVIIGFHVEKNNGRVERAEHVESASPLKTSTCSTRLKQIFDDGRAIPTDHINAYLAPAEDVFVESSSKSIWGAKRMTKGNQPTDDGNFILTPEERSGILAATPALEPYLLRYVGSKDFIRDDVVRFCLWLRDASPALYHANREVMRRLAAVREFRLRSSAAPTRKAADTPWRFFSTPQTDGPYLAIPEVSSERRQYIPIGFMPGNVIASNKLLIVPGATLYDFGVLASSVHMAWMRTVGGRLKSDYQYSGAVVYNTFPWPDNTPLPLRGTPPSLGGELASTPSKIEGVAEGRGSMMATISKTAQTILDARAAHPGCSLAVLYDPLTMPPDLRAAHEANDRAVLEAYGLVNGRDARSPSEPEIVAHLFNLYAEKMGERHVQP